MLENPLTELQIDEHHLEEQYHKIDLDNDIDLVRDKLFGLKRCIQGFQGLSFEKVEKDYTDNPFLKLRYSKTGNNIFVYPDFKPEYGMRVTIRGYRPIFNNDCSLILCSSERKNFIFFNPENKPDYQDLVGKNVDIRLAAVTIGGSLNTLEFERLENPVFEEFKNPLGIGKNNWPPALYETIFNIKGIKEKKGDYFNLRVKNPINQDNNLELITNADNFSESDIKSMETCFYLIGHHI